MSRKRGSGTHGHGSSKKRRGAGSRGGRGRAGYGKKAKHKKVKFLQEKNLEKGLKGKDKEKNTINLLEIDQKIQDFIEEGSAEEKGDKIVFDAGKAGYDKVLGKGKISENIKVEAPSFSKKAIDKLSEHEISD